MPFLRFSRDRRGCELTTLVHTVRRGGKPRTETLYVFRTPQNIRVGRTALDNEARRTIEENNPELSFDWPRILERMPAAEEAGRGRRERGQGPAAADGAEALPGKSPRGAKRRKPQGPRAGRQRQHAASPGEQDGKNRSPQ